MKILNFKKNGNNSKGITLIVLVISIIILLILASVSINIVINNGLFDKAKLAVDKYSEDEELEQIQLTVVLAQMKNGILTAENLNSELQQAFNNDKTVIESSNYYFYKTDKNYRIYKNGKVEKGTLLPDEFQQVEYIESTGTQYIDTNITYNSNNSYYISANLCFTNISGLQLQGWDAGGAFGINQDLFFNGAVCIHYAKANQFYDIKLEIFPGNSTLYYEDKTISRNNLSLSAYAMENGYPIFAQVSKGEYVNFMFQKLKGMNINLNGKEIRNFIPCKSTTIVNNADGNSVPTNTKGLYDLVEGKFYTNKNTSGDDFTAGPNA